MATEEILFELLPDRRPRANPRAVKRKMSGFALKRSHHRRHPQPTCDPRNAIRVHIPPAA